MRITAVVLLVFISFPVRVFAGESTSDPSELDQQFADISCLFQAVMIEGLQYYPCADWQLRSGTCIIDNKGTVKRDYERITHYHLRHGEQLRTCGVSHFDWIANLPSPEDMIVARDLAVTTETLTLARNFELVRDPYSKDAFLGYVGTTSDFALISMGPDGDLDILPFYYTTKGALVDQNGLSVNVKELESAGESLTRPVSAYRRFELNLPVDQFYDPTNGTLSNGDIVYHASKHYENCFSY